MVHAANLSIVQGNTAPDIYITVQRNGNVVDLTGCTVSLILSLDGTITNTGHQICTIDDADGGVVFYRPATGDFSTAGDYVADVKIVYSDASIEICQEQMTISVRAKLS